MHRFEKYSNEIDKDIWNGVQSIMEKSKKTDV